MGNRSGFTLIETLFSLMTASIVLTLCFTGMSLLHQIKPVEKPMTDKEIMFKQLQNELMLAKDISTDHGQLRYYKDEQWFTLFLDQNRLVKKDGYEIYLYDVDRLCFEVSDYIYLTVYQGEKADRRIIGVYYDSE